MESLSPFLLSTWSVHAKLAGLVWAEVKQLWDDGAKVYMQDMWNILDFITNSLYIATFTLKLVAYLRVSKLFPSVSPVGWHTGRFIYLVVLSSVRPVILRSKVQTLFDNGNPQPEATRLNRNLREGKQKERKISRLLLRWKAFLDTVGARTKTSAFWIDTSSLQGPSPLNWAWFKLTFFHMSSLWQFLIREPMSLSDA